jgi:hypothetical protein
VQTQLDRIKSEFEREIFLAVYRSREQRMRRAGALGLLFVRHFLRGALIGFPIYLVTLALALAPAQTGYRWLLLILLPGVLGWTWVLIRGAWSDYRRHAHHCLLEPGFARRLWQDEESR